MSLTECVELIQLKFPQENVILRQKNYVLDAWEPHPHPKYLYRGENYSYPQTKSSYQRLQEGKLKKFNLKEWKIIENLIRKLSAQLAQKFHEFEPNTIPSYEPIINSVGGYLQHYGFPIFWMDFTSNLAVAAFFAAKKNEIGNKGKIGIIETAQWIEDPNGKIMELIYSQAKRPREQSAYSLKLYDNDDLKKNPKVRWIQFEFSETDNTFCDQKNYLSTEGDFMAKEIIEFLGPQINQIKKESIRLFLSKILIDLKELH